MNTAAAELMPETLTQVAEYNATAAGLAALREEYRGATFEITTAAGMAAAKAVRAVLRGIRVDLEKTRKEIKAPALERCNLIDAEAKRITAELVELEQPIDQQIKAEEARREERRLEVERQERERLAAIATRIEGIRIYPLNYVGAPSDVLEAAIESLATRADILDGFGEAHLPDAMAARDEALEKLRAMLASTQEAEQAAAQAAREAEELREAQAAEQARLDAQRADLERREAEAAERERITRESFEAEQAAAQAERDEADRLAAEKRAADDEAARLERERLAAEQAERQRILDDQAEEQRQRERAARERHEREEAERAESLRLEEEKRAEADAIARAEAEELEISRATLRSAAIEAVALLIELGQEDHLATRKLAAALDATIEARA